jgi:hypothetical protein
METAPNHGGFVLPTDSHAGRDIKIKDSLIRQLFFEKVPELGMVSA